MSSVLDQVSVFIKLEPIASYPHNIEIPS